MRIKIKNSRIILTIICFLKFSPTYAEENASNVITTENHQVFFNQIDNLKQTVTQLEADFDKLQNGLQQQAGIIYEYEHKDLTETIPENSNNHNEQIEEFYKNLNIKSSNLNDNTEQFLHKNNLLLWNKTQKVAQIIESFNKCIAIKRETIPGDIQIKISKLSEKLENQINRIEILKGKIENFDNYDDNLEKNSVHFSKMLNEIFTKLASQDKYFVNMENQLPVIQGASKTLDDYIARKTDFFNSRERCKNGNCHHWHRHHFHHRN